MLFLKVLWVDLFLARAEDIRWLACSSRCMKKAVKYCRGDNRQDRC